MRVLKIILLILWMMIIFAFSNQKAVDSSNLSSGLIDRTVVKVYKVFYGDISKEKDCPINLSITPDNKLTIMVATKKRIFRLLDADESEEYILNTIIEAIKTSEKGFTL